MPSGFTTSSSEPNNRPICSHPRRVISVSGRSEALGRDEGHDEVDGEAAGDDATEDECEHGAPLQPADGAGVQAERNQDADAECDEDDIEHGKSPSLDVARSIAPLPLRVRAGSGAGEIRIP